jgi:hypothetical protein
VNNVEIPNSKRIEISLQYIYGIGSTTAKQILVNTVSDSPAAGGWSGGMVDRAVGKDVGWLLMLRQGYLCLNEGLQAAAGCCRLLSRTAAPMGCGVWQQHWDTRQLQVSAIEWQRQSVAGQRRVMKGRCCFACLMAETQGYRGGNMAVVAV